MYPCAAGGMLFQRRFWNMYDMLHERPPQPDIDKSELGEIFATTIVRDGEPIVLSLL
jgi:hypothetical protein